MKTEKRIIALCLCSLVIGMAITLPLTYVTPKAVGAQTNSWFDTDIVYANVIPSPLGALDGSEDLINIVPHFALTPDALNLKGADAKVEVFNFHVYSDQTSIVNITAWLARTGRILEAPAIGEVANDYVTFADGTKYDFKDAVGKTAVITCAGVLSERYGEDGLGFNSCTGVILAEGGEKELAQALVNLRTAQTLYIDVTRVMTITYQHQANADLTTSSITTTLANNSEVMAHTELAKTDFGFATGPVPDFMLNDPYEHWTYIVPPGTITTLQIR
jgi:hypothetical protein